MNRPKFRFDRYETVEDVAPQIACIYHCLDYHQEYLTLQTVSQANNMLKYLDLMLITSFSLFTTKYQVSLQSVKNWKLLFTRQIFWLHLTTVWSTIQHHWNPPNLKVVCSANFLTHTPLSYDSTSRLCGFSVNCPMKHQSLKVGHMFYSLNWDDYMSYHWHTSNHSKAAMLQLELQ